MVGLMDTEDVETLPFYGPNSFLSVLGDFLLDHEVGGMVNVIFLFQCLAAFIYCVATRRILPYFSGENEKQPPMSIWLQQFRWHLYAHAIFFIGQMTLSSSINAVTWFHHAASLPVFAAYLYLDSILCAVHIFPHVIHAYFWATFWLKWLPLATEGMNIALLSMYNGSLALATLVGLFQPMFDKSAHGAYPMFVPFFCWALLAGNASWYCTNALHWHGTEMDSSGVHSTMLEAVCLRSTFRFASNDYDSVRINAFLMMWVLLGVMFMVAYGIARIVVPETAKAIPALFIPNSTISYQRVTTTNTRTTTTDEDGKVISSERKTNLQVGWEFNSTRRVTETVKGSKTVSVSHNYESNFTFFRRLMLMSDTSADPPESPLGHDDHHHHHHHHHHDDNSSSPSSAREDANGSLTDDSRKIKGTPANKSFADDMFPRHRSEKEPVMNKESFDHIGHDNHDKSE